MTLICNSIHFDLNSSLVQSSFKKHLDEFALTVAFSSTPIFSLRSSTTVSNVTSIKLLLYFLHFEI